MTMSVQGLKDLRSCSENIGIPIFCSQISLIFVPTYISERC